MGNAWKRETVLPPVWETCTEFLDSAYGSPSLNLQECRLLSQMSFALFISSYWAGRWGGWVCTLTMQERLGVRLFLRFFFLKKQKSRLNWIKNWEWRVLGPRNPHFTKLSWWFWCLPKVENHWYKQSAILHRATIYETSQMLLPHIELTIAMQP